MPLNFPLTATLGPITVAGDPAAVTWSAVGSLEAGPFCSRVNIDSLIPSRQFRPSKLGVNCQTTLCSLRLPSPISTFIHLLRLAPPLLGCRYDVLHLVLWTSLLTCFVSTFLTLNSIIGRILVFFVLRCCLVRLLFSSPSQIGLSYSKTWEIFKTLRPPSAPGRTSIPVKMPSRGQSTSY